MDPRQFARTALGGLLWCSAGSATADDLTLAFTPDRTLEAGRTGVYGCYNDPGEARGSLEAAPAEGTCHSGKLGVAAGGEIAFPAEFISAALGSSLALAGPTSIVTRTTNLDTAGSPAFERGSLEYQLHEIHSSGEETLIASGTAIEDFVGVGGRKEGAFDIGAYTLAPGSRLRLRLGVSGPYEVPASTTSRYDLLFGGTGGSSGYNYSDVGISFTLVDDLPPVAHAGADFTVDEGQSATLSGASSTDPENRSLTYAWTQVGGPQVTLSNADTATPSFTAPAVSADALVTFRLSVTDPSGATNSDEIDVTIRNVNRPPVANAGVDFAVVENQDASLNAAASSDPDSETLSYAWTQTGGPAVTLTHASTATPGFTAPDVLDDTLLAFSLTVRDPAGLASTDTVNVTVRAADALSEVEAQPTGPEGGALPGVFLAPLLLVALVRRQRRGATVLLSVLGVAAGTPSSAQAGAISPAGFGTADAAVRTQPLVRANSFMYSTSAFTPASGIAL